MAQQIEEKENKQHDEEDVKRQETASQYSLTISVIKNKLSLHLHDSSTKYIYNGTFSSSDLRKCGFSDTQSANLEGVSKFLATAKQGHNNLEFTMKIGKSEIEQNNAVVNDIEGAYGLDDSNNKKSVHIDQSDVAIVTVIKKDDCFGTMKCVMTLKQIPREKSDINEEFINDLKNEIKKLQVKNDELAIKNHELEIKNNELMQHTMPKGVISMWSGSINDIPKGWSLCDGNNNTPDLRNRFIVGAANQYGIQSTGGSANHTHGITVNGHSLSINEMPSHSHNMGPNCYYKTPDSSNGWTVCGKGQKSFSRGCMSTKNCGGGQAHSHTSESSTESNIPPYFALAFIMKLV